MWRSPYVSRRRPWRNIEEERECDGFTYIWEQASFNPIDGMMDCHIHFTFPDGSRMDRAFSYRWRLWTLPELREMLAEAGFRDIVVYWEGTDEDANEGNGIFEPAGRIFDRFFKGVHVNGN